MTRPRRVALPWYRAADYARLCSLMADGDRLPARYDAWRLSAEQVEREVARSGVAVVRIEIEPEAFAAWCAHHGLARDGAARARFANEAMQQAPEAPAAAARIATT